MPERLGVFILPAEDGGLEPALVRQLEADAIRLPGVCYVEALPPDDRPDPERLADRLRAHELTGIVLAGTRPGYFKAAFTRALVLAHGDPGSVRLASFREYGAGDDVGDRARAVLACAVLDVPFALAAEPALTPTHPATLVIGGGVAGIQAALEIADSGHRVHLVEKSATIGGHMAMFDKTFPTLDCAACILTPKMVAAGRHENITLHTCAEVVELTGGPGAYRARVRKRARRVDLDACVACNVCADWCPVSAPSEFDAGVGSRKAIYIPFPQAVPNAYVVDPETCTWVLTDGKKCGACVRKCTKDAIHLAEQDTDVALDAGNVIVATGYDVFDARRIERYGYGRYPNVLTALEFERLTNASGPTGGRIVMKTRRYDKRKKAEEWVFAPDGPPPSRIAIVHCVGSRDRHYNAYCSRVCCMYSLKFAHLVREKLPDAVCQEFYIDMRAFGKGYEEFFDRIRHEGVAVVRGRSVSVHERDGALVVRGENILSGGVLELQADMVLLAVGLQPTPDAASIAALLGLARDEDGWFSESHYNADPTGTERGGIYLAGACQGPKDIPDTVAQASAAAASVLDALVFGAGHGSRGPLSLPDIERRARELAGGAR